MYVLGARAQCNIQVGRIGRRLLDRSLDCAHLPRDHLHTDAGAGVATGILSGPNSWYFGSVILSRAGRFNHSWKPRMRPSCCSGISECTMPRPGSHPLHAAGYQHAFMAVIVAMAHASIQHVGHSLEPAVRMFRKARDVVIRRIRPELVEHEEWIELRERRLADHAPELYARAIGSRHSAYDTNHSRESCCSTGGVGTSHLQLLISSCRGNRRAYRANAALILFSRCSGESPRPSARMKVTSVTPMNPNTCFR